MEETSGRSSVAASVGSIQRLVRVRLESFGVFRGRKRRLEKKGGSRVRVILRRGQKVHKTAEKIQIVSWFGPALSTFEEYLTVLAQLI
jgi:hypothetical protein